jgi:flagellar assembly factor FliW
MLLNTRDFGTIEIDETKKITFKEGIPGFEKFKGYILIEDTDEDSPFAYLQCIEDAAVCFVIADPYVFMPGYSPDIKEQYLEMLGGGTADDFSVFAIVTIPTGFEDSTLNLLSPLIIQNETRLGKQVILEGTDYTTKHRITELLTERQG